MLPERITGYVQGYRRRGISAGQGGRVWTSRAPEGTSGAAGGSTAIDCGNIACGHKAGLNWPQNIGASRLAAEVAEYLLTKGADIQAKCTRLGHEGLTALHLAARHGRLNVVEVLLANGADINARTDKGSTASSLAQAQAQYLPPSEAQNYNAIVQFLHEHGAKE